MNKEDIERLSNQSTESLTKRLAGLSIETHTINTILSNRRNDTDSIISECILTSSPESSSVQVLETGREQSSVDTRRTSSVSELSSFDKHDRRGRILDIGDKVKVLTKGRYKITEGYITSFGKFVSIEDCHGVVVQRKSTNLILL